MATRKKEVLPAALSDSPWGAAVISADGTILEANASLCEFLGYGAGSLGGVALSKVLAESGAAWPPPRCCAQGFAFRRADGSLVCGRAAFSPCGAGHLLQVAGDNGDRAQTAATHLGLAAAAAGIGFWEYNALTGEASWDDRMLKMFGVSGGDLARQWEESIHADDRERVVEAARRALVEGGRDSQDYRIVRAGGEVRHIRDLSVVVRDEAGNAVRHLGVNIDITDHARAEEALRLVNERMSLAAKTAGIGFWEYDFATKQQNWDDGVLAIYGLRREEFSGNWDDYLHPDDAGTATGLVYSAIAEGRTEVQQVFRIRRPDGAVRHIRSALTIRYGAGGEPSKLIGTNFDITEQLEAETVLRQTLENLPIPVACGSLDKDLPRIISINRAFAETFGYSLADIPTVGRWAELAYPDPAYRADVMSWWGRALEKSAHSGAVGSREVMVRCKDGTDRECILSATVFQGGTVVVFQDMTERNRVARELEEARRTTEKAAHEVTENIPAGTYIVTPVPDPASGYRLDFKYASSRFLELLGLEREDIFARPEVVLESMHPEDLPAMHASNMRALTMGEPFRWEGRVKVRGSERWFAIASNPRVGPGGAKVWDGVVTDITQRREAEGRLVEALRVEQRLRREADILREKAEFADRAKSAFLAKMSHEVRTPLSALIALAQAMWMESEKHELSPAFESFLNRVRSGGKYLNLVLTNLLDVSAAESGRAPVRRTEFYLADWIEDVRNIISPIAESQGATLSWTVPRDPELRVSTDSMRLTQVFLNLAHNAIKFGGEGKVKVRIRLGVKAGRLLLVVEDNGPGIPPARVEELFQAFRQNGGSGASYERGVGLGLAVVKLNVGLLGGAVRVEQVRPHGARFEAEIPCAPAEKPRAPRRPSAPLAKRGAKR